MMSPDPSHDQKPRMLPGGSQSDFKQLYLSPDLEPFKAVIPELPVITTPRRLFIDMNSFYASVEQQEHPTLRAKPLIVVQVKSENTKAIAASYEAKALGIKTGTYVRDARALCSAIAVVQARNELYLEYHRRILSRLQTFFSEVAPYSVDEFSCNLAAPMDEPALRALTASIKQDISHAVGSQIRASVGIGPNVFLAKIAADMMKPDGFTFLGADYPARLFSLPLQDLPGIGPRTADKLQLKGIDSIEKLWSADPQLLEAIWSKPLVASWMLKLRGSLEHDYGALYQAENRSSNVGSVSRSHVLAPEDRTTERAGAKFMQLADAALSALRSQSMIAHKVDVEVGFYVRGVQEQLYWNHHATRIAGANDIASWAADIKGLLNSSGIPRDATILRIGISFSRIMPVSMRQDGLIDGSTRQKGAAAEVMDVINRRFGRKVIGPLSTYSLTPLPKRISFGPPQQ